MSVSNSARQGRAPTAVISSEDLDGALSIRDLTDESQGNHGMQILVQQARETLLQAWGCRQVVYRSCPVVWVADNYDALGYPPEGVARDARYSRYVSSRTLLRTQTSAGIPTLLRSLSADPPEDILLSVPGLVYRRDVIDRLHCGEPHQLDLWRIKRGRLGPEDLLEMIRLVLGALLPEREYRVQPASHPYTVDGLQIDIRDAEDWVEIGECGVASPRLLESCGLDTALISGLAMGLGMDRILMLRKGISDIRLLRASDSRVSKQMVDLRPYKPVSNQPATQRDLSVAVPLDLTPEELGDQVRSALGERVDLLEALEILSSTPYADLPESAKARMGVQPDQKNLLVRLVIRHPTRSLSTAEANRLRNEVYLEIHRGAARELAGG